MLLARKIRLLLTEEQEVLFKKSAGTARWSYNFYLSEVNRVYKEYLDNGKQGKKSISEGEVRKYINNVLKPDTHKWLSEVSSNVMKQGVKDAATAYDRFFKGISGKPSFKAKNREKPSFYVNYESLKKVPNGFRGEKLGFVRTAEPLPDLKPDTKYSNPHITFDGKYWYLSVGYEVAEEQETPMGEVIGIDLGIKELAVCSNGKFYKNINKTRKVRRIKKHLKRKQRKLARQLRANTKEYKEVNGYPVPVFERRLSECKNIQKTKQEIKLLYRRLTNIRNNHLHQTTSEIVKAKPSQVVMEDLNVSGMMKNKHLAEAIQEQKWYEFRRQMEYKCKRNNIKFSTAPRFYASSKLCSNCGNKKVDLTLNDRTYICEHCGFVIDRDLNASINLAHCYMDIA